MTQVPNLKRRVELGFESVSLRIKLSDIEPLRSVTPLTKKSVKYGQIVASIVEVGIIEPPVVIRKSGKGKPYQLLDGHIRIEILKERGEIDAVCLIAKDDEAFTYNKRISRMATVQEHKMILTAIQNGVPEERLARALNVNISSIRNKRRLLDGICSEVVQLLQDRHVPLNTFTELKRLKPMRQIEVSEMMIAMNRFSMTYAKSLVASTPQHMLTKDERKSIKGISPEQLEKMERESTNLEREFKLIENEYGADHLDLVLATGYLCRMLGNARMVGHLAQFFPEILAEFQSIAQTRTAP